MSTTTSVTVLPTSSPIPVVNDDSVPAHHSSPVVAFLIGLSIILLASILNAGGLNLTKLDHVRTSIIPKASRKKDWMRPLWLLGMLLYILSQLIGSTLALEYMRAEYVAPLGSTSLIFNFLFASMLVGTPVTSTDIYGTVIVILGVVGIVLFGSINSGLESEFDLKRLKGLWGRANWLFYFMIMSLALIILYNFVSQLELILHARSDLSAEPFAAVHRSAEQRGKAVGWRMKMLRKHENALFWIRERLESWTAAKDDKTLAWTLGIGWACCGGGLAGGCLVFAKACVKLISGSLSHRNTGNQFLHVASIFTFILLGLTAVFQIICLNRGLKVYDSTLVVPVFYGVYTASGFLNSLIFNNEVDAYKTWTLCLIFFSILVLISGVVLLTHKKPEARVPQPTALSSVSPRTKRSNGTKGARGSKLDLADEDDALRVREEGDSVVWELGDASDDEDDGEGSHKDPRGSSRIGLVGAVSGEEGKGLMQEPEDDTHVHEPDHRRSNSSEATVVRPDANPFKDDDEFGVWEGSPSHGSERH
ncbi:hypothetical protein BD410DRAFT_784180 [Rickenella mellea]|uniref:DUF803-domain-containing protein n=1 Tax=Rickenella mellea TaxID=50990 RepID=A0A4Y7QEP7_9AGAM|nr:hypothetical protein BD410DRAFT_784180 [Rickenella mellea]